MGHGARGAAAFVSPIRRGYAAHMKTPLFIDGATALIVASGEASLCIMCAEIDPADCHRSYIADWLVARGEHAARLF